MSKTLTINAAITTNDRVDAIPSGVLVEVASFSKDDNGTETSNMNIFLRSYESQAAKDSGKSAISPVEIPNAMTISVTDTELEASYIYDVIKTKLKAKLVEILVVPSMDIVI